MQNSQRMKMNEVVYFYDFLSDLGCRNSLYNLPGTYIWRKTIAFSHSSAAIDPPHKKIPLAYNICIIFQDIMLKD